MGGRPSTNAYLATLFGTAFAAPAVSVVVSWIWTAKVIDRMVEAGLPTTDVGFIYPLIAVWAFYWVAIGLIGALVPLVAVRSPWARWLGTLWLTAVCMYFVNDFYGRPSMVGGDQTLDLGNLAPFRLVGVGLVLLLVAWLWLVTARLGTWRVPPAAQTPAEPVATTTA